MRKPVLHILFFSLLSIAFLPYLAAQPMNDDCVNAISIGEVTSYDFSNLMATTDGPDHPNSCQSPGASPAVTYNDIWYAYTATFSGYAEWTICGTANFDTKIMVYNAGSSCPVTDADLYTCSEDAAGCLNATSAVIFEVTMNETYLLRLGAYGDGSPGEFGEGNFTISETDQPPMGPENDNCANAIEVMLGNDQAFDDTNANTDGPSHPTASCYAFGNDLVNQDIWYYFVAPNTATIEWTTCSITLFDTRMAVYNAVPGDCPLADDDLLVCNDDGVGCEDFTSYLTFLVTAGETYLLRLGGYSNTDFGAGVFNLNEIIPPDPPINDDCMNSAITGMVVSEAEAQSGGGLLVGTTIAGTQDAGIPPCLNNGELFDVWYTFNSGLDTALDFRFTINTPESAFILELYNNCTTPALDTTNGGLINTTCITYEQGSAFTSTIINGLDINTDYFVRVSTVITYNFPGDFWLQIVSNAGPVGTIDEYTLENVRFYPNPVSQGAQIELSLKESAKVNMEVVNPFGQVVNSQNEGILQPGNNKLELNTVVLSPGVYFLHISADEKQKILKFIKQ